jgi:hypothetical protein
VTEEVQLCIAVTFPQTLETPPEYCENEALEGEEFCAQHIGNDEDWEPDPWFEDDRFEDDVLFSLDDLEPFE